MKVRWREHEFIFVTILVAAQVIFALLKLYEPGRHVSSEIVTRFREIGIAFMYGKNVLLPQISSALLVYLVYVSISFVIMPLIKRISFDDVEKIFSLNTVLTFFTVITTAYALAIGVNLITWYARPHLTNYNEFQFLAICGYNGQPLTNLFFGFERALGAVALFTCFAGIREFVTWLIERPGAQRAFRILVMNNTTPLVFLYFLVLLYLNPVHQDFLTYVAFITPVLLLYIYTTFWLFPLADGGRFFQKNILVKWLLFTFICTAFCTALIGNHNPVPVFIFYWLCLLLLITPLCWLLYLQRKDKILQLKGLEKELAKSGADPQFLRSQINPHFLFNALNTLYGTALKEKPEHTAEGIQKLGDMMRFMLHENNLDAIPMSKEIDYLKNYIALQKLRTESSPNIIIEDNIEEADCKQMIAPMLLIPFVENAFKHGISLQEESWINIMLHCTEKMINFEVRNSVHNRNGSDPEKNNSGIGLKNVTERLKLLYPHNHRITITGSKEEFAIHLVIEQFKN